MAWTYECICLSERGEIGNQAEREREMKRDEQFIVGLSIQNKIDSRAAVPKSSGICKRKYGVGNVWLISLKKHSSTLAHLSGEIRLMILLFAEQCPVLGRGDRSRESSCGLLSVGCW